MYDKQSKKNMQQTTFYIRQYHNAKQLQAQQNMQQKKLSGQPFQKKFIEKLIKQQFI